MLKEIKDKSIKEEGERMVPAFHKGFLVYGEHISRYESVQHLLKGKVVLDIASGSGYGTYILAETAKKVYGVEIEPEAVEYSKRNYAKSNIEYRIGSAEAIPLDDNSVDVVVTFETIEHIEDYKKFITEMKRVLKPDGFAIVSTPNDPEFPEGNHFHLHEFEEPELRKLLSKHFNHVDFHYQYTWLLAGILSDDKAQKDGEFELAITNTAPVNKNKALYFMAICSDKPITNLKIKEGAVISEHYSARQITDKEARQQKEKEDLKRGYEAEKNRADSLRDELNHIYGSRGWKLLNAVYTTKHKLTKLFR